MAFVSALMESGVELVACDFPHANKLTIHILAAMAEHAAALNERDAVTSFGAKWHPNTVRRILACAA